MNNLYFHGDSVAYSVSVRLLIRFDRYICIYMKIYVYIYEMFTFAISGKVDFLKLRLEPLSKFSHRAQTWTFHLVHRGCVVLRLSYIYIIYNLKEHAQRCNCRIFPLNSRRAPVNLIGFLLRRRSQ